jgi:hypothetical protein
VAERAFEKFRQNSNDIDLHGAKVRLFVNPAIHRQAYAFSLHAHRTGSLFFARDKTGFFHLACPDVSFAFQDWLK